MRSIPSSGDQDDKIFILSQSMASELSEGMLNGKTHIFDVSDEHSVSYLKSLDI
jgi:hypothetical protein